MNLQSLTPVAWVSTGLAALVVATHMTMTFLHVAPVNPVKVEHETAISRWTEPLFDQNWKLFAPDPIAVDQGVLVRARLADGTETSYVDIVTPYLMDKHHNLLASRAGYQVTGVLTRFLEARELVVADLSADEGATAGLFLGPAHLSDADEDDRFIYDQSLRDLRDSALAHLGGDVAAGDVTDVQLRIVQHEFPRFSQRDDEGLGAISHSTSDWLSIEGASA